MPLNDMLEKKTATSSCIKNLAPLTTTTITPIFTLLPLTNHSNSKQQPNFLSNSFFSFNNNNKAEFVD